MNITIILSACLFSLIVACTILTYNFNKINFKYKKLFIDMIILEKIVNSSEEQKIKTDESIHKENFIKFLSESRDWAFTYIEDVQSVLTNFIEDIKPEIEYFREYGDVVSMQPNYYSMKKITEAYDELIKLLPKEEEEVK